MAGQNLELTVTLVGVIRELVGPLREAAQAVKDFSTAAKSRMAEAGEATARAAQSAEALRSKWRGIASELGGEALKFTAAGAAITGAFAIGAQAGVSFEKQLSAIKAVSGATAEEMVVLRDLALEMGETTKFSAAEAAQGIEELIKAGMTVEQVIGGGARAALKLAEAGMIELGQAAELVGVGMNAFRIPADEAMRVADALAGAANASAADVSDLSQAMQQSSAIAASLGLSFEDTSAALAVLAQNALVGSDAGTSLRVMLTRFLPASKEAKDAMDALGLSFYDANGQFIGMEAAVALLEEKTRGLTQEQQQLAVQTIFGQDAARAATLMIAEQRRAVDENTTALGKMKAKMADVTAEQVAKDRMNNIAGATEELRSRIETLLINAFEPFKGALRVIIDGLAAAVGWMASFAKEHPILTGVVLGTVGALGLLFLAIGAILGVLAALAAAYASVTGAVILYNTANGTAYTATTLLTAATAGLRAMLVSLYTAGLKPLLVFLATNPIGLLILAMGALLVALRFVLGSWTEVWEFIKWSISTLIEIIQAAVDWVLEKVGNALEFILTLMDGALSALKSGWDAAIGWMGAKLDWLLAKARSVMLSIGGLTSGVFGAFMDDSGSAEFGSRMTSIPAMAAGGVVSRPTLAMIGEAGPEAVIPLSKLAGLLHGGGTSGGGVNVGGITINGYNKDPLQLANEVAAAIFARRGR